MNKTETNDFQKTTVPSLKNFSNERKWYIINLRDKVIGNVATKVANILRGKNKPIFFPNLDVGDFVVLINSDFLKFTGKKKQRNFFYNHSGYPGGLRKRSWEFVFNKKSEELVYMIIKGMMPHTKLAEKQIKRLFIYRKNHSLKAQEKYFINI